MSQTTLPIDSVECDKTLTVCRVVVYWSHYQLEPSQTNKGRKVMNDSVHCDNASITMWIKDEL